MSYGRKLQGIVENHQRGTLFGIRMDSDGLLMHGPRLTWMDAAVGNDVITPEQEKPWKSKPSGITP